ncbi:Jerky -like [Araneus ventricosus]|uniref:Jerky-like n=1 Tax=Araneus ventricosus TaxID=182803 RepID=A0A4Y2CZA5_ARAVE|nr:Jerky -like [Araneus ventricosus]
MKNWTTFFTDGLFRKEVPTSGIMIQQKALNFNSKLGGSKEFQASSGWLEKFKNSHGIHQLSIVGEKLSSGIEAGNSFVAELQDFIVKEKLTADQIYNCDETVLYWRALPTKTLAVVNEAVAPGQKKMKDRVPMLLAHIV